MKRAATASGGWEIPEGDTYFAPLLKADPRGFEIAHLEEALKHCRRFRSAVDGGAHIGTWSAWLAQRFERVVAYEPAEDTWACCSRNLKLYRNAVAVQCALGEAYGVAQMSDDAKRPGNTGARFLAQGGGIEVRPLDREEIHDLDFLKLDLEGYEYFALRGAEKTLRRCRPVVVIEEKKGMAERFRLKHGEASAYLAHLGAREAARIRNDVVFTFPDA